MFLIVGLGNPGAQYEKNRHNVGFVAVDVLAQHYNFPNFKTNKKSLLSEGHIGSHKVILLKPQTYMNLSGPAVAQCAQFYKIPLENIIVIHDELDVKLGDLKIKQGGGSGGHNGLKSIDAHLGNAYLRMRVGVDHPGHRDLVSSYVLSNFSSTEQDLINNLLEKFSKDIPVFLDKGSAAFLNILKNKNTSQKVEKKEPEKPKKEKELPFKSEEKTFSFFDKLKQLKDKF